MTHRGHSHTTLVYGFTRDRGNDSANAQRKLFRCCYRAANQWMSDFTAIARNARLSQGNHPATGYVTHRAHVRRCDEIMRADSRDSDPGHPGMGHSTLAISNYNLTHSSIFTTLATPASREITGYSPVPVAGRGRTGEESDHTGHSHSLPLDSNIVP